MFTGPAEEAVNAKVGKAGSVRKGGECWEGEVLIVQA